VARPEGLEPPAYWFEASRSIHLSYGRGNHIIRFLCRVLRRGRYNGSVANDRSGIENEVKLSISDIARVRAVLADHQFSILHERGFESNEVFDTAAREFRARGELIRLREAGGRCFLTFKGAPLPGGHKRREELETPVERAEAIAAIFGRLGLVVVFRYEKYRTEYQRPGETGIVTLDETPIGDFLELEGEPAWIDRTAAELGFSRSDYILASYGGLYLDHCRRKGIVPRNMTFAAGE
jgi:adenylate cyclase class 2